MAQQTNKQSNKKTTSNISNHTNYKLAKMKGHVNEKPQSSPKKRQLATMVLDSSNEPQAKTRTITADAENSILHDIATNPPNKNGKNQSLNKQNKSSSQSNVNKKQQKNSDNNKNNQTSMKNKQTETQGQNNNSDIEGVLKSTKVVQPASNNAGTIIRNNIIGKKSGIKVIANKPLVVASIIFLVLLAISIMSNFIILGMAEHRINNPPISLTQTAIVQTMESADVGVLSITLTRAVLPGASFMQNVKVATKELEQDMVVRVKGSFTTGDGEVLSMELRVKKDWIEGADGYYYYNQKLLSAQNISAVEGFRLPTSYELSKEGKNLNVANFIFETLPANKALISDVWTTAHKDWLTQVFE